MSRMRGNRSDWETLSVRKRKANLSAYEMLARGRCSQCQRAVADVPKGCAEKGCPLQREPQRARPVQREAQHARLFAIRSYRHWWQPGLTRIEHRTDNWREADTRAQEGAKTGLPDYWLFIPGDWGRVPVRAVCELKAPEETPVNARREWWLDPWPEGQKTRYGLRRDQWWWLQTLDGAGFHTCVAYGHDQAEAFFCSVAGPRPKELPRRWHDTSA